MSTCRCGHWFADCVLCGWAESRLEYLALAAGVSADWLRDYLRREIARRIHDESRRSEADGGS